MKKIKVQIIGPTGSGKTIIANLLRFQLASSVSGLVFDDADPPLENWEPSFKMGQGALENTVVEIQTIQTRADPE